jgi:hypothetical protein
MFGSGSGWLFSWLTNLSMNFTRYFLTVLVLGATLLAPAMFAAGPSPESRTDRLDGLVRLDAAQRQQALDIFRREDAELEALSAKDRLRKSFEIRSDSRARIRALLNPEQLHVFNRAPQFQGGGLNIPTPEAKLKQLDQETGLTPDQRQAALAVFTEEFNALVDLTLDERMLKGGPARRAAQNQIRDLLTPAQIAKQESRRAAAEAVDIEERTAMQKALRENAEVAGRVGAIVRLSSNWSSSAVDDIGRKGSATFAVVGDRATARFTVSWERKPASAPVKVINVVSAPDQAPE